MHPCQRGSAAVCAVARSTNAVLAMDNGKRTEKMDEIPADGGDFFNIVYGLHEFFKTNSVRNFFLILCISHCTFFIVHLL